MILAWASPFNKIKQAHYNPFVTSPGDLCNLGRPFRYEPRRSPGLIAWDNNDVIK